MLFNCIVHPGDIAIITLFGELDQFATQKIRHQLSRAILQGEVRTIIWQLAPVTFMDSSGVGLILGRMRELSAVNGQMLLLNPSPTMEKIFQFSGLSQYVLHATEQDAILHARGIVNG